MSLKENYRCVDRRDHHSFFKQAGTVYLVDFGFLFLAKETKRTAINVIFYEPNFYKG